ncbi:uncharacterized protein LOC116159676 [Photinus pyralis]|uniref:uncharacterized protein LOC116159676 n=1 Tax=Photinus pyralis TaxID=7054 RepID=UPI001267518C|nr:uncharacterized protein LOC116159676 [Photinus pyralis]
MKIVSVALCLVLPYAIGFTYNVPPDKLRYWDNLIEQHKQECMEENGIDPKVGQTFLLSQEIPDEENYRCYMKCLAKATGIYDTTNHVYLKESTMTNLGITEEIFYECFQRDGEDDCDKVHSSVECLMQKFIV